MNVPVLPLGSSPAWPTERVASGKQGGATSLIQTPIKHAALPKKEARGAGQSGVRWVQA